MEHAGNAARRQLHLSDSDGIARVGNWSDRYVDRVTIFLGYPRCPVQVIAARLLRGGDLGEGRSPL
jgi:hypothetical protein